MTRTLPPDLTDDVAELELCKLFHCTPSQLDREDWHRINRLGAIHNTMERWRSEEAESSARKAARRK